MEKLSSKNLIALLLFSIIATLIIYSKIGLQVLDVTEKHWMLLPCSDMFDHYLSWSYFRRSPWLWPPGMFQDYIYPLHASIGLSDGIPLFSIPLKAFDSILPETFQFYGWWYFVCFVLQGIAGYKILTLLLLEDKVTPVIGGVFFMIHAPLVNKVDHAALLSHWLILFGVYYYVKSLYSGSKAKTHKAFLILIGLGAAIHPYMVVFVLLIYLAFNIRLSVVEKVQTIRKSAIYMSAAFAVIMVLWYLSGNLSVSGGEVSSTGFDIYSSNFNDLINSRGRSSFVPGLPTMYSADFESMEGFAYLGTAVLLMLVIGAATQWKTITSVIRSKQYLPLTVLTILLFIYSLGGKWYLGSIELLDMPYPKFITNVFRSAGRYGWLMQYVLISLSIVLTARLIKSAKLKWLFFAGLLALQAYDIFPIFKNKYDYHKTFAPPIDRAAWDTLLQPVDRLLTIPFNAYEYNDPCDRNLVTFLGDEHALPISAGKVAYFNKATQNELQRQFFDSLLARAPMPKFLCLASKDEMQSFKDIFHTGVYDFYLLDNYLLMSNVPFAGFSKAGKSKLISYHVERWDQVSEPLWTYIKQHANNTMLISIKDEAKTNLDTAVVRVLQSYGSSIGDLQFRGSYAAVIDNGNIIWEKVDNSNAIDTSWNAGDQAAKFTFSKDVALKSAGIHTGNISSIQVQGKEYSHQHRGFNIVVLDSMFNVSESVNFDTYKNSFHKRTLDISNR